MRKFVLGALLLLAPTLAAAQTSVRQQGNITPGHAVKWLSTGVIGDAGTASSGSLTTLGITNSGGQGLCINSAVTTSPYNQLCLGVTTNGGAKISSYTYGGATTPGITFDINGTLQGFLAVQGAVAVNDAACFADTSGNIKSCGTGVPVTGPASSTVNAFAIWNSTTGAALKSVGPCTDGYFIGGSSTTCQGFLQTGTGATTRTWQDKDRDFFSVKDFGTTGTANDDAVIQAAIDAMIASSSTSRKTLYFPCGTYNLVAGVTVSGANTNFWAIRGENASCVSIWTTANVPMLTLNNNTDMYFVAVEQITFGSTISGTRTSNAAILITGTTAGKYLNYSRFANIRCYTTYYCIRITKGGVGVDGLTDWNVYDNIQTVATDYGIVVERGSGTGNVFSNMNLVSTAQAMAFNGIGGATVGDITIGNIQVGGGVTTGFYFSPTAAYRERITLINTQVDAGTGTAISMDGYAHVTVMGNSVGGAYTNSFSNMGPIKCYSWGCTDVTTHGDSNYTILANDRNVVTSAAFTAPRTWTLPPANYMDVGRQLCVLDQAGAVTSTNTLTVTRAGSDTINGGTSYVINNAYGGVCLQSDESSKWTVIVRNVAQGGTGISSGTSGGIPYFSSSTTIASSAALADTYIVLGGGAGAAPKTQTSCQIVDPNFACASTASNSPQQSNYNLTVDATGPSYNLQKSRNGAIVSSGDLMGAVIGMGHDGTTLRAGVQVLMEVDGTPGASDMPGRIRFLVTPDGSATPAEAFRVSNTGQVNVATATDATSSTTGSVITAGGIGVAKAINVGTAATIGTFASVGTKIRAAGTAPALTSCGTSPSITGSDLAGEVTMGTTATGCVITFNAAYSSAPYCTVTWQATPLASQSYTVSTSAITTVQTSTSSNKLNYVCMARSGG